MIVDALHGLQHAYVHALGSRSCTWPNGVDNGLKGWDGMAGHILYVGAMLPGGCVIYRHILYFVFQGKEM